MTNDHHPLSPPSTQTVDVATGMDDSSVADVAMNRLGRQVAAAFTVGRRRLWGHIALMALILAVIAGGAAFLLASLLAPDRTEWLHAGATAGGLAMVVSILTAAGLYPVLRQREQWLAQAVSIISENNIGLLSLLGKLTELRDRETAGHTLRVSLYALQFAEELGLSPEVVVRTTKGALVHDIGKLAVPDRVLEKPGPLSPRERTEMAAHVAFGVEMVMRSQFLSDAIPLVADHHERYDGNGYPRGLKGEAIPLEARMFALIDVFDALTSRRVYKGALTVEQALAAMAEGRGSHFDPALFDRFVEVAPALARQLPRDEQGLLAMLARRLLPYLDRFLLGQSLPQ